MHPARPLLLLAGALLGALSLPAFAAPKAPLVAVMELKNKLRGVEKDEVDAGYLTDLVRSAVLESAPGAQVMTRENITVLLAAQGKKLEDCEGECEVDTGRRLGADFIISGEILKFGSSLKVNLKLHETENGRLLSGVQVSGATVDEIDRTTPPQVRKLVAPIRGDAQAPPQARPPPAQPAPQPAPPEEDDGVAAQAERDRAAQAEAREQERRRQEADRERDRMVNAARPASPPPAVEQKRGGGLEFEIGTGLALLRPEIPAACQDCSASGLRVEAEVGLAFRPGNAGLRIGVSPGFGYHRSTLSDGGALSLTVSGTHLFINVPIEYFVTESFAVGWIPRMTRGLSASSDAGTVRADTDFKFRWQRVQLALLFGKTRFGFFAELPVSGPLAYGMAAGYVF